MSLSGNVTLLASRIATEFNSIRTALTGKADTVHTHAAGDVASGTLGIARIPTGTSSTTVALGNHNHDGTYAPISHTHSISNVTNLQTALDGKPDSAEVDTIQVLTQSAYNAIGTKNSRTLYVVVG